MMGVFVYALDAETGKLLWSNDSLGSLFIPQPHNTPAFSGLAPQGYLAVGGRQAPRARRTLGAGGARPRDRATPLLPPRGQRRCGGFDVSVGEDFFCNNFQVFDLATGQGGFIRNWYGTRNWPAPLIDGNRLISNANYEPARLTPSPSARARMPRATGSSACPRSRIRPARRRRRLRPRQGRASSSIAGGDKTHHAALLPDLPAKPKIVWQKAIDGTVAALAVANGRLYASTREGKLYCFGAEKVEPKTLTYRALTSTAQRLPPRARCF